jgi:myo-inositol 2-dehydrogenase / D-chiro-inositol 1-dehydrogenase
MKGGKTMDLGVAFIGAGMVSDLHHLALSNLPNMKLVGVYDVNQEATQRRAREWDVRGYGSMNEVLDDRSVDVAYILTPAETHVPIALQFLESGKHVLVEKPVSYDPKEIEALEAAAKRYERVALPAHNYAYIPEFRRIVRLARSGSLGTIRGVWVKYAIKHPELVASAYGGVLEEVMIHHSYMTLAIMGAPVRLFAGLHEGFWERHPKEDQAWMVWEYADGTSAHLFSTFACDDNSADPWTFMVKVLGEEGSASLTWRSSIFSNKMTGWFAFGIPVYEESYEGEGRAMYEAVANDQPPVSTLQDAATSARIIAAAYEAGNEHKVVNRQEDGRERW